ncbi:MULTISPECIES: Na+/H+ antiporter subunit D [unclassified Rothia (in: high G+C Gram-positive bacteria)]|uniref:Na+/H+ antiporter subunit D n=1 Tax=unclassified Rothia (in: high G+C Gram-positive bacteria) TaxID=2689056 RepID=UPI00195F0423|nr:MULTISPECIES: Na+/H+ antiporter subunit D [unclassified Rothia (in: high G+C Gram-positive bacteria)]MBM7051663.1 Na+/H+ antiporter subunit D [Rothia sp. ZJ1223]QRZ61699.1 Na+/H+ antiporter subunit D [Rothia sp. ZJ932]
MNIFALAPLSVALLFFAAALTFILLKYPRAQALISFGAILVALGLEITLLLAVWNKEPQAVHLGGWEAPFGIVMVVDQLSALMLVVSSTISLAVLVFATGQNLADEDDEVPISVYYPTYLLLIAGVSNAFLAGDLFNLYVGFEILLFASYVLTTMNASTERIRAGVTYVVVSVISSMLFLIAIGFIYASVGTVNMADLALKLGTLPEGTRMQLHLMLLIAFGIKAAVFPLSLWLPDSYPTAPAPVTAVFAGLLTKVGVYSIIRTETLLFPGGHLNTLLAIVAILTLFVGILGALAQKDIKRLLSFTLISHIGYMIWGIALSSELALTTVVFYIAHHIVIQTALFMVVGLIERRTGSTNTDRLGGMLAISPVLGVLYMVPALNLGGIPPFSGFIGKIGLLQASADAGTWQAYAMAGVGVLVSLLTLIALMRIWNKAFWRPVAQAEDPMVELLSAEESDNPSRYKHKPIPTSMFYSTLGLISVSVAITFLAPPLFELADFASDNLFEPDRYVQAVFGQTAPTIEEYLADHAGGAQ